jgi:rod shape-determining protein MreD
MTLLLAAVGATVTALLELTIGPYLRVGNAEPHLVLVVGIIVTLALDLEAGLVWAFVGGLVLDVLAQRPLGSSAFALLLCLGLAALLGHWFVRLRQIIPIPIAFILGVVYSMTLFVAFNALAAPIPVADPMARVLPSAVFDLFVATLIGPLAISIHDRRVDVERVDW